MNNHFLKFKDISTYDINEITDRAIELKSGSQSNVLSNLSAVLLFEKPSLRTKLGFWVGVQKLGGNPLYFGPEEVGLGSRESVRDVSSVISRIADIIIIRTFEHEKIHEFSKYSSVPVINALTDHEHPCQALADIQTIKENLTEIKGSKVAFIGDGNNVSRSLSYALAGSGANLVIASPNNYQIDDKTIDCANRYAINTGGSVTKISDPKKAVLNADIIYTDVWASMGQEKEQEIRKAAFERYQVNENLLDMASKNVKFMHDLPAHPNEEISENLLYDERSIVFPQSENRMWSQMALIEKIIKRK
ncbi:MAG: ornithine carbamoyltransferase [Chloroflexi bacterium]|mgnify:FL=1|nr:ornithine carbamoyltransferase [Chloroflexota bacterium]|tara:strand:+ start:24903 stop:25817 length:915 start_codon:yes stop_codon:yes gene_type:complete